MKNDKVQAALGRFKGVFDGFTNGQRAVTVIAVVVAIVGGVVFMSWLQKPAMTPLFTGLSSTDASAITAKLSESGTPYELSDSGKTVLVPSSEVNQRRIDLAGQGLPAGEQDGAGGYGMLDKQPFSSSDRQQRMTEKRAIEGELSKAIETIDKVNSAQVLLALPEKDVFAAEESTTKATVVVTMRPQAQLETGKVDAIVHLVSGAVPNLDSKNVTVTDAAGKLLNAPGAGGAGAGQADARMAQAAAKSAELEAKVQTMLDKVLGPGNSSVAVNAELSFDNTKIESHEYLPLDATDKPLTGTTKQETMTGNGTVPQGGVLGPDSTLVPSTGGSNSSSKYDNKSDQYVNPYDERKTTTEVAQGGVKKVTAAVLLNTSASGGMSQQAIQQLVQNAIGANAADISVARAAFDTKAADAAKKAAEDEAAAARMDQLMDWGKNGLLGLALLLGILIAVKKSRKQDDEPEDLGELPSAVLPELPQLPAAPTPLEYELDDELPALEATPTDPQSEARVHARAEIGALVEEDADEVARLLRGWMTERS